MTNFMFEFEHYKLYTYWPAMQQSKLLKIELPEVPE